MKTYTEKLKVLHKEYLKSSIYGNPKQSLYLEDKYNNRFRAQTATNALCGYQHYSIDKTYLISYHYTKTGNIIIDYSEEV